MANRFTGYAALIAGAAIMTAQAAFAQDVKTQELNAELQALLPAKVRDSGVINIAGTFDNPPGLYADINDSTKAVGVAPDLAKAVGEVLGVQTVWHNTPWAGQLPGLYGGTFDIVWGQLSVTAEREEDVLDITPWVQHGLGFLVAAGNPDQISDWASLCGKSVALALGSIFIQTITNASNTYCVGKEPITPREYQGNEEPAVRSGQVHAMIDTSSTVKGIAKGAADAFDAVILTEAQSREFYAGLAGVAIDKKNPELTHAVYGALRQIYDNGTWTQIAEKYGTVDEMPSSDTLKINVLSGTAVGEVVKK